MSAPEKSEKCREEAGVTGRVNDVK